MQLLRHNTRAPSSVKDMHASTNAVDTQPSTHNLFLEIHASKRPGVCRCRHRAPRMCTHCVTGITACNAHALAPQHPQMETTQSYTLARP